MSENLKVKILKKSKEAPFPEHIIVERKLTHEMVHLYFDDGYLTKLTHIKRDPNIKMAWDEKEKKYKAALPNYLVVQDIVFQEDKECHPRKSTYLKGPEKQNFFGFSVSPVWNQSCIGFKAYPDSLSCFFVHMDLNDRCTPKAYINNLGNTDIQEIYPHQKRKTRPCPKILNELTRS